MKRLSTPADLLLLGLIWLATASSAEASQIVDLFSDDERPCRQQLITWADLSPAGIGTVNPLLRFDRKTEDDCEDTDRDDEITAMPGGGFAGGFGGLLGGYPGGSSAAIAATGAAAGLGQLATPPDLSAPPPPFDTPPIGDGNAVRNPPHVDGPGGGGNDVTIGISGTTVVLSLGTSVMTIPLLPGGEPITIPPGSVTAAQDLNDPSLAVVPEPGSFLLIGTGLALIARRLRRRIP